jgi:ParB family chromosome partitioning protein
VQVDIASIRIRKRIRKDLDEIDDLAESLNRFGQLHPIVITRRKTLVAGRRRLEAAKSLGWTTIEATILGTSDAKRRLELELEENVQRSPLRHDEIEAALARLEKLRHPGFFRRIWNAIVQFVSRLFNAED